MKLKRFIAAMSAAVLFFTPVYADTPITRGEAADMLIKAADDYTPDLRKSDILQGYEDGKLHEEKELTRAEALVMLKRAFGEFPEPKGHNLRSGYPASNFTDVPEWAETEIADVLSSGIVAGTSEDTLSPDDIITDDQLELLIKRTYAYMGTNLKDDFWATVNKESLDSLEIPQGEISVGGGFATVDDTVKEQINTIVDELLAGNYEKGSEEQKMADFYRSALNSEYRSKTGLAPIMPYMELIDKAESVEDIVSVNNTLIKELAIAPFLSFCIDVDLKDNSKNKLELGVPIGSLGSKDLYEDQNIIAEYKKLIETYFKAIGETDDKAAYDAEAVLDLDTRLMSHGPDLQDMNDVDKLYNLYKFDDVNAMFPGVDLDSVFEAVGYDESWKTTDVLVLFPDYMKAMAAEFTEDNIDALKAYAKFTVLFNIGKALSDELLEASDNFAEATGTGARITLEQRALKSLEANFPDYLGKIYAEKYFSAEKKQNIESMVKDMIDFYKERIKNIDWMSDATKEKALLKLNEMKILIGYPDEYKDPYEYAEINSDSYFDNLVSMNLSAQKKSVEEQFETIDENYMGYAVYEVNAGYNSTMNEIIFPAAILQAPFYDYDASYETNLGGIGYVIAHEITHAFDTTGSLFDEKGNASNWWTEEDRATFDALCDKMIEYYDGVEIAPGITANGETTIGENIADNGALNCILEIASKLENPDYDALFRSAAHCFAESADRSSLEYYAVIDVHSNDKLRINKVFENNQIFYDTYGINEGDGMYVAPEDRVRIW